MSTLRNFILITGLLSLTVIGCQSVNPPAPTTIPTVTLPATPTSALSNTPAPTLRPIVTNTLGVTPSVAVIQATLPPTQGPASYTAKAGDTVISIMTHFNLPLSAEDAFLSLNGMNDTVIQPGQSYLIPRPTATPTKEGADQTKQFQLTILPSLAGPTQAYTLAKYSIVKNDDISAVMIKTGATLRQLCDLNDATTDNPHPLVCSSTCNLDAAVGQTGCRVIVVEGAWLYYPGPTPTPTITPSLTGSETITPTPTYAPPRILSPLDGATTDGIGQISWVSVGILQPDEIYLVVLTDAASQQTVERQTRSNSIPYPLELQPQDSQPHTINWRVGIARLSSDGSTYVLISPLSNIYRFIWQSS